MRSAFCSNASELAIRAAIYLALQPPGKLSTIHDIARNTGLPEAYLAKVLQRLTSAGLVRAFRGPGGGLELGRAPHAISLASIVRAIEGPIESDWCLLGLDTCSQENSCPLHQRWAPLRERMQRLLDQTTLATLTRELREAADWADRPWGRARSEVSRRPNEGRGKQNA